MGEINTEEVTNKLGELYAVFEKDLETIIRVKEKNEVINKHFTSIKQVKFIKITSYVEDLLDSSNISMERAFSSLYDIIEKLEETNDIKSEAKEITKVLAKIYDNLNDDFEKLMTVRSENADVSLYLQSKNNIELNELVKDIEDFLYYVNDNTERGFSTLSEAEIQLMKLGK